MSTAPDVSVAQDMSSPSSPSTTPAPRFLALPAEVRVAIYEQIIASVPVADSKNVAEYSGLILSCRTIHAEFEAEALADILRFLIDLRAKAPGVEIEFCAPARLGQKVKLGLGRKRSFGATGGRAIPMKELEHGSLANSGGWIAWWTME
jgi:hypothetical protein